MGAARPHPTFPEVIPERGGEPPDGEGEEGGGGGEPPRR